MVCLRMHLPRYCQTSLTVLPCYTLVFLMCFFRGPSLALSSKCMRSPSHPFVRCSKKRAESMGVSFFEGALLAVVLKGDQKEATPVWANCWDKPESLA